MKKLYYVLILFFVSAGYLFSQANYWKQITDAPAAIHRLIVDESSGNIWAAGDSNIYFYNGITWSAKGNPNHGFGITAIAVAPNSAVYISSGTNLYQSTDNGDTWGNVFIVESNIRTILIDSSGAVCFGTRGHGFYRPNSNGWEQANNGLSDLTINSLTLAPNGTLYAGTNAGVCRSINNGDDWQPSLNYNTVTIYGLSAADNDTIFSAAGIKGILKSTNAGANWVQVAAYNTSQIIYNSKTGHLFINSFTADSYGNVYSSTDLGISWKNVSAGLSGTVNTIAVDTSTETKEAQSSVCGQTYIGTSNGLFASASSSDIPSVKGGMFSARVGAGPILFSFYSIGLDVPIYCNINFSFNYFNGRTVKFEGGLGEPFSGFLFGLGYVLKKTDNFIVKFNICPGIMSFKEEREFGLSLGVDILLKVYKPCYVSITPGRVFGSSGNITTISLGLNWVY